MKGQLGHQNKKKSFVSYSDHFTKDYSAIQKETSSKDLIGRHSSSRGSTRGRLLLVIIFVIFACIAVSLFTVTQLVLQLSTKEQSVRLLTENTTVLLGTYAIRKHENALAVITQKILDEDSPHVNTFSIVPSSKVVIHLEAFKEHNSVVPIVDDAVTLNERYVYMLEESVLKYRICLGNAKKASETTLYGFDSEESYKYFLASPEPFASNGIFSKKFQIGSHGNITCGNATFTANQSGYYFFVLKTKYANTQVNYSVVADLQRLEIKDYLQTASFNSCRIDSYNSVKSCSLGFAGSVARQWSLIGFSDRNYDLNSRLSHVEVDMSYSRDTTYTVLYNALYYGSIGVVSGCGLCAVVSLVYFTFTHLRTYHRNMWKKITSIDECFS